MSALKAGLCLLPVGLLIVVLSPRTGKYVGAHRPRLPLVVSGVALTAGGAVSLLVRPATPLVGVLAIYLLIGVFQGTVNPPTTNTAVSGMPRSIASVATSLSSAGRQTGTTLGVAIAGTIVGTAVVHGRSTYTDAGHGVWWLVIGLGLAIAALALISTGNWAKATAARAASLFEEVDKGAKAPQSAGHP